MNPEDTRKTEENQPSGKGGVSFAPQKLISRARRIRTIWLLLSGDVWGIVLLLGIIAIITFAIVGFGLGGSDENASTTAEGTQNCTGITGISIDPIDFTVSPHLPAAVEAVGCVNNATYTWTASPAVGSFVVTDDPSTIYIPPVVASGSKSITLTLSVCDSTSGACTKYTTSVTATRDSPGITCLGSNACLPADNQYCVTSSSTTGLCPVSSGRSCCEVQKIAKPPAGVVYTCPSGDYLSCLKQYFNIDLRNANTTERKLMFQTFAYAAKAPSYVKLLTNGGVLRITMHYPGYADCAGYTPGANEIRTGACITSFTYFAHWIIHESGHVIADRNPYLKSAFPLSTLQNQDPTCYDNIGYLRSYPLSGACNYSTSAFAIRSENFAEALAYYTTYMDHYNPWQQDKRGNYCQKFFNTFQTVCNNTYAWEKVNIFNNYEY
jgi:hypothetical protein